MIDTVMNVAGPTTIAADRIVFKPGGKIVIANGAPVTLEAKHIQAATGASIAIEGVGVVGQPGSKGQPCDHCASPGVTEDINAFNAAMSECAQGRAPHNYGKNGSQGGIGGAAPVVVLRTDDLVGIVTCNLTGGPGGPGGPGGTGRVLCHNECGPGHPMYNCRDGLQGSQGLQGPNGDCQRERLTRSR